MSNLPGNKPPRGAMPNPAHPMARGLVMACLFNEGDGSRCFDSARRVSGSLAASGAGGTSTWTGGGWKSIPNGITGCQYFDMPVAGLPTIGAGSFSVLFGASIVGTTPWYSIVLDGYFWKFTFGFAGGKLSYASGDLGTTDWRNAGTHNFGIIRRSIATNGVEGYADGIQTGTATDSFSHTANSTLWIGRGNTDVFPFSGTVYYAYFFNRALSATEIMHFNADPYCMFRPVWVPLPAPATTATNLSGASLDALIQKTGIVSPVSLDALLMQALGRATGLDGLLNQTRTGQAILDAIIRLTTAGVLSLDALIMGIRSGAVSLDGLISTLTQHSISLDALVRAVATGSVSLDAILVHTLFSGASLDALLKAGRTGSLLMDSLIKAAVARVVSLDALIMGIRSGAVSLDAMVRAIYRTGLSLDALVSRAAWGSVSLDSLVLRAAHGVTSLDALIMPEAWDPPYQSEIKAPVRLREASAMKRTVEIVAKPRRVTAQ